LLSQAWQHALLGGINSTRCLPGMLGRHGKLMLYRSYLNRVFDNMFESLCSFIYASADRIYLKWNNFILFFVMFLVYQ
jgi:hypothetical protein